MLSITQRHFFSVLKFIVAQVNTTKKKQKQKLLTPRKEIKK